MKSLRWWGWAVLMAATTAVGCCSWAERNCPHAAYPNNCCQPCAPACCPPTANYPSGGGWSNPTGASNGCCTPHY